MSLIEKLNFLCTNDEILQRFLEIFHDLNKDPWCADRMCILVMIYVVVHVKKLNS